MPRSLFDLSGKVAIVTGGGRGIGKSIALGLAEHGADVAVCSRTKKDLEEIVKEVEKLRRRGLALTLDLCQPSQFDGVVAEVKRAFGHIDVLVNNAGIVRFAPALEVDENSWDLVMNTNAKGAFFLSQKVGQIMVQQGKGGSIINVTSEVVQTVELNHGAYCPSKAALNNITKILAAEWGKYKIRVNSLAPCFVKTEINAPLFAQKDWYENKLRKVPLGRNSEPQDLIGAAVFLSSDASSYVSGTTILVDGGYTT
jgi:NAD(P)-dependent dehydrogenase (short-subunit alcohol dehydrogenase family)